MIYLLVVVMYWAPAIVAHSRKHNDVGAILVLNLTLGWTVLGWIVAAVWCSTGNVRKPPELRRDDLPGGRSCVDGWGDS